MGDYRVQVKHGVRPPDVAEISDLLVATTAADGHPPLDDQRQLDLQRGGREGFTAVLAHEVDDAELVGYAQLAPERASWGLEIVVHPDHRGGLEHLGITLLGAAVEEVHRQGGGRLRYWAPQPTPQQDANAAALGFINDRDLLQLRVELPLAPGTRRDAPPLDVRPFRPGDDEAAWLEVNNRAFADHPEQGGWDLEALQAPRGRAVVRPGRLPPPRGGRPTGRVVLDEGAPGRRPAHGRDLRHLGRPRLPAAGASAAP